MAPLLPSFACPRCRAGPLDAHGPPPTAAPPARPQALLRALLTADADVDSLRTALRLCGLLAEHRPLCWRLLLGQVPASLALRAAAVASSRDRYRALCEPLLAGGALPEPLQPISLDVPRTHCRLHPWLFSDPRMQSSLTRTLFALATVFPRVAYFQGLNEVPIPFYVCYLRQHGPLSPAGLAALSDGALLDVEADVFSSLLRVLEPVYRCTQASAQQIHAVEQTQVGRLHLLHLCARLTPSSGWPKWCKSRTRSCSIICRRCKWTLCSLPFAGT